MKKIRTATIWVTVTAMLMSACGSMAGGRVDSGEIVVPEMSSEDLLVSSLEYLLQDDGDTAERETEPSTEEAPQKAEEEAENQVKEDTEENEETRLEQERAPKKNEAVIYYGNAGTYELNQEIIQIEEDPAQELLDALAKHNIVSIDTKLISLEEREAAGEKILYLNLSRAAGEYLKTMSREAECIILASVVNTFLENYNADGVCIVVEEKPLTTKNAEYGEALKRCTPEELLERIAMYEEDPGQKDKQEQEVKDTDSEEVSDDTDSGSEEE